METSGASSPPPAPTGSSSNKKLTIGSIAALILMVAVGVWTRRGDFGASMPTEKDMPVIMKEAAGTAPIPANDPPARKAIRDSFRYLLEEDKSYNEDLEERFRTRAMANLLRPSSFGHVPSMEELIRELRELKDVEAAHLEAVQRFPEVARENLQKAGLGARDVEAFEKGMAKGMGESVELLADAITAEAKWIDAVIALYQFAIDNDAAISVSNNFTLEFEDEVTQTEFDRLASRVDELGKVSEEANAAFDASQQNAQRKSGITRRDLAR
jgi:hypothetical protein